MRLLHILLCSLLSFVLVGGCPPVGGDDDDATGDDDDVTGDDDDATGDDDDATGDDDDATGNTAPTANDDSATTQVGAAVWIDVLDNDTDPEGDPLEIEVLSPASNGSVVQDSGGVEYTPDPGFVGVDTFDYLVGDDGGLTDGATVTVEVICVGGLQLLSEAYTGGPGSASSRGPQVSADGTFVVFESDADDLAPGDTNGTTDVYLADRSTGEVERVSMGWDGSEPDGVASYPVISADGAWVAYQSNATNLVDDDTNGLWDIFLWERATGTTTRASRMSDGGQSDGASTDATLSEDGRYVAFTSFGDLTPVVTYGTTDVYVFDRVDETTELISVSMGGTDGIQTSAYPGISGDGNLVVFSSLAWDLVPGDTDGFIDIFVRNRATSTTTRVNLPTGVLAADNASNQPVISGDGNTVAFVSNATNLVVGDTNGQTDVFSVALGTGTIERISVDSGEGQSTHVSGHVQLSADGRFAAFLSEGILDADGTAGVYDLYVRDRTLGTTAMASYGCGGQPSAEDLNAPVGITGDGTGIVFSTDEADLLLPASDTNGADDIFWVPNPLAP